MSSTQNSQNLLVNVLRPVYTYSSETGFTAGVVATNLKAVNTDAITAGVAQLGDTGGNIYLGSNAGSTTVGTNSNNVAFGVGAASGINGVQNSVFIGASAGQGISNASNDVVIGAGTSVVGSRNIVIGNNDLVTGSNNFVIASDTTLTGSYKVNIGNLIQGDISAKTLSFTTGTDISGGGYFGGNVGIRYPNPTHSLDVSGSIYATSNVILSDGSQNRPSLTFANDASAGIFRDASGNVGFARAGRYAMKLDPSGSVLYTDLTVEGTLACATFDAGGIATTNLAVPGYIRNNDLTFVTDISQGNFSFTGTGRSRVANITFSNTRINASGGIAGTNFDLSSGNLILSNNVVAGGFFSNTATNTSNYLGGVYLVDNEVRPSRVLEKGTGAFDLCSNGLSLIGKITGGDDTQSNRIGGITLSNSNAIVPGFLRNALTPTTLNISGGNISNSGNTISSNFTTITASSNNIGGVVLNATNVSNVGTLGTTNALVSGYLRDELTPSGLDISGGNISISGTIRPTNIIGLPAASNVLGNITMSNSVLAAATIRNALTPSTLDISGGNISNSSTTTSSNFTTPTASSNSIGGVVLNASNVSNISTLTSTNSIVSGYLRNALTPTTLNISGGNISNSGNTLSSNFTTPTASSNNIGGVVLNNNTISNSSTTTSSSFTTPTASSNNIGGVVLNNNTISNSSTTTSSNFTTPTSSSNNIGGVTINSGTILAPNGNVSSPGVCVNDASTGFFKSFGVVMVANGLKVAEFQSNNIQFFYNGGFSGQISNYQIQIANNVTPTNPPYSFSNDTASGLFYNNAVGQIGLATGGIGRLFVSNANVGIGTSAPASLLTVAGDISYSGKLINSPINNSNFIGGVVLSNGFMRAGLGSATGPGISFSNDTDTGVFGGTNVLGFTTGGTERMRIDANGYVGIGTSAPAYTLDVSTAAGSAAINMNTWPRVSTVSNTYFGVFSSIANNVITWTTSNAINSSLMTVGVNNGTYFQVNKSGIWSINASLVGTPSTTNVMIIDTSTNPAHNTYATSGYPIIMSVTNAGGNYIGVSWTGYLPSNTSYYYKTKMGGMTVNVTGATGGRIHITFLTEAPDAAYLPF